MAHEKDERGAAMLSKRAGEGGDDSHRRPAANSRSAPRESEGIVPQAPPSGRRAERYVIGSRTAAVTQAFDQPRRSMDDVVAYLDRQEHVEVLKRIKLGGTRPFTADGRSVGEIVVVAVEEGKAQRLRASAPPDLIIERDSLLSGADYLPVCARAAQSGTLFAPLRSTAIELSIRVIGRT